MNVIWKDIEGYEGLYQISINGNVRCLRKNKPFLVKKQKRQYYLVELNKNKKRKLFTIHRLLAKTFIPNPNNYPIINHKDGNKYNNKIENLEWCTYSDNLIHAYKSNLRVAATKGKFGKDNIRSIPIYQIDKNTKKILKEFNSIKEAADYMKCSSSNISMCCRNKRKTVRGFIWKHKTEICRKEE